MQLPYTVTKVWRAIHVWELFTCETSHQSEILHSLIFKCFEWMGGPRKNVLSEFNSSQI